MIIPQNHQQIIILGLDPFTSEHFHKVLHTLLTQLGHEFQVFILFDLVFLDCVFSQRVRVSLGEQFPKSVEKRQEFQVQ